MNRLIDYSDKVAAMQCLLDDVMAKHPGLAAGMTGFKS